MSVSQALATPVDEIMESIGVGPAQWVPPGAAMPSVPKRQVRKKVNDLLATGASYAMIVRALGGGQRQARQV